MISLAKKSGFEVILLTNGTLMDADVANKLIELHLDEVKVSLWATNPDQYEKCYPDCPPENFHKVLANLRGLHQLKQAKGTKKPKTIIHHVIHRDNFQTLDQAVQMALDTGCDGLFFAPLADIGRRFGSSMLSQEEVQEVVRFLSGLGREPSRLKHNIGWALSRYEHFFPWETGLPCYAAWYHARVRVNGSVQPCGRCDPRVDFGNINEVPFPTLWNGPAIRDFRGTMMTMDGLASMQGKCDCVNCCFVWDNLRVHRVFRFLLPFVRPGKDPSPVGTGRADGA
jgi:MoaA/NifB/PqqE/SkfB family radical SAM enzyme